MKINKRNEIVEKDNPRKTSSKIIATHTPNRFRMHELRGAYSISNLTRQREGQANKGDGSPNTASKETKLVELFRISCSYPQQKQNGEEPTRNIDRKIPPNIAKSSLDLLYKAHFLPNIREALGIANLYNSRSRVVLMDSRTLLPSPRSL